MVADAGKDATAAADDSMQQSFEEKRAENVPMEESPAKEEKKDEGNRPKKAETDVTVCEIFFPFLSFFFFSTKCCSGCRRRVAVRVE